MEVVRVRQHKRKTKWSEVSSEQKNKTLISAHPKFQYSQGSQCIYLAKEKCNWKLTKSSKTIVEYKFAWRVSKFNNKS